MYRRSALAVAVALLALTAGCLGAVSAQDNTVADADGPTVSVSGTGAVSTDPDRALVAVAVVATGETAQEARSKAAERMNGLRAALADAGITDDQVETTGYFLHPRYDRDGDLQEFQVTHGIRVETSDVENAGAIVDAAVAGGANRVNGVTFTLSADRERELRAEAIGDAVRFARADADAIADAAGVEVVGLRTASTSGGFTPVHYGREAVADAGAGTTIDPGTVTVRVTVNAVYGVQ